MRENLHRFFRAARGAGVRLSPAESIDAMRAVAKVGFADRGVLRDTLLLTLAKTQDEKRALGECFDLFFELPEPSQSAPESTSDGESGPAAPQAPERAEAAGQPTEGLGPLAQMRLAQDRAFSARPYAQMLTNVLKSLVARAEIYDPETGEPKHPLLAHRAEKNILLIVVTGDK